MKQKYMFRIRTAFLPSRRHGGAREIVEMTKVELLGCNAFGDAIVRDSSGWFSRAEELDPNDEERWQQQMAPPRRELATADLINLRSWARKLEPNT